jgi:hypothetical protein
MEEASNIGPREIRKRALLGSVLLIAAVLGGAAMIRFKVNPLWRYFMFLPLWGGLLGVLQARAGVCVALSTRGMRNMDRGAEEIADDGEKEAVGKKAVKVYVTSLIAAAVLTIFFAIAG